MVSKRPAKTPTPCFVMPFARRALFYRYVTRSRPPPACWEPISRLRRFPPLRTAEGGERKRGIKAGKRELPLRLGMVEHNQSKTLLFFFPLGQPELWRNMAPVIRQSRSQLMRRRDMSRIAGPWSAVGIPQERRKVSSQGLRERVRKVIPCSFCLLR